MHAMENTASLTNCSGKLIVHIIEMKLDPYLSPILKLNQNGLKGIDTKTETLHMVGGDKASRTLEDLGTSKDFLNRKLQLGAEPTALHHPLPK